MFEALTIQSHRGPYVAEFEKEAFAELRNGTPDKSHFIIDRKVAKLYESQLRQVLNSPSVLLIDATEESKTLDQFTAYIEFLVNHGARRGDKLVAIGGGIIQDITCFIAATLMRGLDWEFFPTTLLAQADSCIGSKSSINVGSTKNLLGTFTPPQRVVISPEVLKTLESKDILSGIGEIIKVHILDGMESFDRLARDYEQILSDRATLLKYIVGSLLIKKGFIEEDEFDRGVRNLLNYGHSFGHAIESATNFAIPHGIAVTMGMDMANYVSCKRANLPARDFQRMHSLLFKNYAPFAKTAVPLDLFMKNIAKDKKNVGAKLKLILLDNSSRAQAILVEPDSAFQALCDQYLKNERVA